MWEVTRKGVIAELENIPEENWDYRPGPGARSVRELARHIAESAAGFTSELLKSEPSFIRLLDPNVQAEIAAALPPARSKTEIIDFLRTSGAESSQRLRLAADTLAAQTMKLFGGEQSRVSGLWFAVSHEMYHRGQTATYARGVGCVPAMTQQTQARLARQA